MDKVGRNDPCPCGSGKKYKQCCLLKKGGSGIKRKLTAKWLNPKQPPQTLAEHEEMNLMERAYGHAAHSSEDTFKAIIPRIYSESDSAKDGAEIKEDKKIP